MHAYHILYWKHSICISNAIIHFDLHIKAFSNLIVLVLQPCTSLNVFATIPSPWIWYMLFELLYVIFRFSIMILYRSVPGFTTGCPRCLSCRGLAKCLLVIYFFENLVCNYSGLVSLTQWRTTCLLILDYVRINVSTSHYPSQCWYRSM